MTDATDPLDGARGLGERGRRVLGEVADWLSENSVDIALSLFAAAVIALVLIGLRALGRRLIRDRGRAVDWKTILGRVLARTSLLFILMCAVELVVAQTSAPYPIRRTVEILFIVAAALQAAVWGRELILGFVHHRVGEAEEHSTLGSAIGIIRLLVTVALFAIALILILDNLGVNVTGLVAGLGIGGIAIGLAAQGIFSDLFAALSIIFDRPFRRGDTITFGTTTGTVERIGLKTTRLRSLNGEEVVVSNANLLNMQLQNWMLLERRRSILTFGLVYQTPVEILAQVEHELKAIVERQELASFARAEAFQFAPSSIDFELVFHVETDDFMVFAHVRQAVMLAMIRRFAELGIRFAYPTQTSFTAAPDGSFILPYGEPKPPQRPSGMG
ncbi:mechanosensitive ion channel family protein [Allosphingosinicella sp.]|jgi:small-conductance mechanosensitive channel|uniref:mechanosensitive ion channel family protein n=1 Tax=Allosphingosinicella sp. TaxID=2823234 RepID=UPI002EE3E8C9